MSIPKASIIMPCYNHAAFINDAVNSILNQSCPDLELIVVDDHSRDESAAILRSLGKADSRLKLVFHEHNQGASRSRNAGLKLAQGEYVGFCDADDLWKSDKLARQIQLFEKWPDCDVTYCDSEIIDESGRFTGEYFSHQFPPPTPATGDLFEVLCSRNFVNMTTVMVRRQEVGARLLFDESIKWVEDWWQWIRLSRYHRFLYEPVALAAYRVHPASTGFTQKTGISRNRWKVGRRNLRAHPDMPARLMALVWYQMGMELCALGKRTLGCRFLSKALFYSWAGGFEPLQLARMSARLVVEWSWAR